MTLAQLALTVLLLGVLGVGANWAGISAIPAYLLAGILLGPNEPHVTRVEDEGATARVRTHTRDDIAVVFVLTRRDAMAPEGFALIDLEVEDVSFVRSYRHQVERLLAQHDRDPAYVLARLENKLARIRAGAAR